METRGRSQVKQRLGRVGTGRVGKVTKADFTAVRMRRWDITRHRYPVSWLL